MSSNAGQSWRNVEIHTIGHSTRTLDELVEILRSFEIVVLVDIRTVPKSRRNPWFNTDALAVDMPARGIVYVHLPRLGGLRHARKDSPNAAWRNASFRGYADHMQTADFEAGLDELLALVPHGKVAIMCAEAVPWRCHRSLVGDVLVARGARVEHIMGVGKSHPHRMTAFAQVHGEQIVYPADDSTMTPNADHASET